MSALHPGVPDLDEGGHAVTPRLGQHGAARHEAHDGPRGWRRRRAAISCLVGVVERERARGRRRWRSRPRRCRGCDPVDRRNRSLGSRASKAAASVGLVGHRAAGSAGGVVPLSPMNSPSSAGCSRPRRSPRRRRPPRRPRPPVGAVGVDDLGVGERGPQAVERRDDRRARRRRWTRRRRGCARRRAGRAPRPGQRRGSMRQDGAAVDGLVAEQHDGFGGGLAGERPVRRCRPAPRTDGRRVALGIGGVPEQRRDGARDAGVDVGLRARRRPRAPQSRPSRRIMRAGISTSSPAVTDGPASRRPKIQSLMTKPSKPHSSRSTSVSSVAALPAPLAVDRVVGAHHGGHALVDDPLEVREVHLVERHARRPSTSTLKRAFSIELQAKCFDAWP